MKRHLVLVGLPGSGKSTVGRLAAAVLGTRAHDVDQAIERAEERSITEIFESHGEQWFREAERRETERALAADPAVVIPGGGWAAEPGNLESVGERGVTVYLKTAPEIASGRLDPESRPLLAGPGPEARMRLLLARREEFYRRCDARVTTDGKTAEEVTAMLVEVARCWAGW